MARFSLLPPRCDLPPDTVAILAQAILAMSRVCKRRRTAKGAFRARQFSHVGHADCSGECDGVPPPPEPFGASDDHVKVHAAFHLEELLLKLYAQGRLDAHAVCVLAYHASKAGAVGESLAKLAYPPDRQSGKYSAHMQRVLPHQVSAPELHILSVPSWAKGRRTQKAFL